MTNFSNMTPELLQDLIAQGALFVINHSAGKDSQAMTQVVRQLVPASQIVVIHAELPGMDWAGLMDHISVNTPGLEIRAVRAGKTFLEMVERRGMWPSASTRQCTSDLKRDPIDKEVRLLCRERGFRTVVHCMGLRAEESSARAKAETFKLNKRESVAGRTVYTWLPIHDFKIGHVWATIADAGQTPHPAYAEGMSRLSCAFCIMACKKDLQTAARLRPELLAEIVALEIKIGHTFQAPKKGQAGRTLDQVIAN